MRICNDCAKKHNFKVIDFKSKLSNCAECKREAWLLDWGVE